LQILINKFEICRISYPIFPQFHLLEAHAEDIGYQIRINEPDFNGFIQEFDNFQSEIPNYNDFKECFLASSCIKYKNLDDFKKKCNYYENMHQKVYFALDTNILYHCFISSSFLKNHKVLIPPTVKEEIMASMNYKFTLTQIEELKSNVPFQSHLLNELKNRRMKKSRKAAYLAKNELNKINTIEAEPITYKPSSYEQNDMKIVKELKNFKNQTGALVILITADRLIVDFCEMENIDYFLFEHPDKIEVLNCSAEIFRSLIYNLAVMFGFIQLNSVIIFGEFRNKKRAEELKLKFLNDKFQEEFQKDLRICRRLIALNIEF